jgi:uncharacterized membrane protein
MAATDSTAPKQRLESVDLLRGLVMVIMALDHVRDHLHLGAMTNDPTDLAHTTPAIFLTRWITHLCAPVFVFLAGTGAFLWGARGRTKDEISRYLLTRGLWLVVLELTVVNWEWNMSVTFSFFFAQVIWALGWSMVALAVLVRLPLPAIGAFGWWMILGHNLFDGVKSDRFGPLGWLWSILHVPGPLVWAPGHTILIVYPLVPWIGVMAAGYAFGSWLANPDPKRRRRLIAVGLLLFAVFAELRTYNFYGDPGPWTHQKDALFTVLSFFNCQKYPPSLLFLLMTLGPSLAFLGLMDRGIPALTRPLVVFGRVPLFYYVIHLLLIDLITAGLAFARYGSKVAQAFKDAQPPADWGYGLPVVYAVWLGVVLALYPVCRWFAGVKARSRSRWLSYL